MEKYTYQTKGVCSTAMHFEIEGDTILSLNVDRGCHGNLQGIAKLVEGRKLDEVIQALDGICCGNKNTSCPDQIAQALKAYMNHH
ncbi:MAG: TIGR03905 family TSCPD domain-containing protein [Solobacterium sp.]|nr:TIGR03905 family TSCPD domain-containing protein [Solobacterium sp.]